MELYDPKIPLFSVLPPKHISPKSTWAHTLPGEAAGERRSDETQSFNHYINKQVWEIAQSYEKKKFRHRKQTFWTSSLNFQSGSCCCVLLGQLSLSLPADELCTGAPTATDTGFFFAVFFSSLFFLSALLILIDCCQGVKKRKFNQKKPVRYTAYFSFNALLTWAQFSHSC